MSDSERIHVEVSVALVTDEHQRVLVTFNDNWGMFTLPMTRRRRGRHQNEPSTRAAIRAAAEALGVPVQMVDQKSQRRQALLRSGRQLVDKLYNYQVFHVEPHPDFAGSLQIRHPHLWLSPHLILSGAYEPISESARFILRGVIEDFGIPARVQHTSVLIIHRDDPERGRQFLVRWGPSWGYALPTKRWEPSESTDPADLASAARAGAERVAREELGLEPTTDVVLTPARTSEFTTHGVTSVTKGAPAFEAPTQYVHSLFAAKLRDREKLGSDQPMAWVTPAEIQGFQTTASQPAPGSPPAPPDRVSRTVYEILRELEEIAEIEPLGPLDEIEDVISRFELRLDKMSRGGDS